MKTTITHMIPLAEVPIPEELLRIPLPSQEEAIGPMQADFLEEYNQINGSHETQVTQEVLESLGGNFQSVDQFNQWLEELYRDQMREIHYYRTILPHVLAYYAAQVRLDLDEEEWAQYLANYEAEIQKQALDRQLTNAEYIEEVLDMPNTPQALEAHAYETFIFHLIARQAFQGAGFHLDQAGYEAFVQHFVLHYLVDELEFKDHYSYPWFLEQGPEMLLNQKWMDFFEPAMTFVPQS